MEDFRRNSRKEGSGESFSTWIRKTCEEGMWRMEADDEQRHESYLRL